MLNIRAREPKLFQKPSEIRGTLSDGTHLGSCVDFEKKWRFFSVVCCFDLGLRAPSFESNSDEQNLVSIPNAKLGWFGTADPIYCTYEAAAKHHWLGAAETSQVRTSGLGCGRHILYNYREWMTGSIWRATEAPGMLMRPCWLGWETYSTVASGSGRLRYREVILMIGGFSVFVVGRTRRQSKVASVTLWWGISKLRSKPQFFLSFSFIIGPRNLYSGLQTVFLQFFGLRLAVFTRFFIKSIANGLHGYLKQKSCSKPSY